MTLGMAVICMVGIFIAAFQWLIYRAVSGRRTLRVGDIVLYVDHDRGGNCNNMVTHVMETFPRHETVVIRGRGDGLTGSTTMLVPVKHLQRLNVSRTEPLQFPGQPIEDKYSLCHNQAVWSVVPLYWFDYKYPSSHKTAA